MARLSTCGFELPMSVSRRSSRLCLRMSPIHSLHSHLAILSLYLILSLHSLLVLLAVAAVVLVGEELRTVCLMSFYSLQSPCSAWGLIDGIELTLLIS
jgi:hypothetical protein